MSKTKDIAVKIVVEISRIVLGVTFIFSGFVKAVDPYGTAYKIEDYLGAFNLSSFSSLALLIACLLCLMEFVLGVFMLLGIYRRWSSRLVLLIMCFMTPLTLYLAIADPVADCGCFGDALVITNWETFFKNIVLLLAAIVVVRNYERIANFFTGKTYWIAFLFIIASTSFFIFQNCIFDPILDFRPYKPGANLPELMYVEEGKGRIEETTLVYVKDGVEKEFTDQDAPWDDAAWEFVRMDTKLISEGITPTIHDFSITEHLFNRSGDKIVESRDITLDVLSDSNYVFLMISPHLDNMSTSYLSHFEDVADYAREYHYGFYCLTASGPDEIVVWDDKHTADFVYCNTDERTLKTIIRSNPGLLLLKNGVVVNKWADIRVPSEEDLSAPLDELSYGQFFDAKEKDKNNLIYISLLFILPLLALKIFDILFFRRKKQQEAKIEEIIEDEKSEEENN